MRPHKPPPPSTPSSTSSSAASASATYIHVLERAVADYEEREAALKVGVLPYLGIATAH